jgi:hypothetical protein
MTGLGAPAVVSIINGTYSIDGGPFTSNPGTVTNGQALRVRLMTSPDLGVAVSTTLTVGGISSVFSASTPGADTTPDPFSFAGRTGAAVNAVITSDPIVVGGINTSTPIVIVGGEYRIDAGAFTTGAGSVTSGQTVTLRLMSSASYATATSATLTIGGVAAIFGVTTENEPADATPDAFSFVTQTSVARNTTVVSNGVTVSGINTPAAISVTGGEYSIGGGPYTSSAGTIASGQTVTVRLTSSASYATTTSAALTIGGVSASFGVTTENEPADTTPDAFSFVAQTSVARNTTVVSNAVTISGINTPAATSVSGGEYSIGGGPYTSGAATIASGQSVTVRLTSSASYATTTTATLTIGGVSRTFTVTTENAPAPDNTPDPFSFATKTNVNPNTTQSSETVSITGITAGTTISVVNGQYKLNNDNWTDVPGVLSSSDTVQVRHTAAMGNLATKVTTLTIGTVSGTFTTITKPGH